jgi:outer membrane murein-binding lipoprotein Lpp
MSGYLDSHWPRHAQSWRQMTTSGVLLLAVIAAPILTAGCSASPTDSQIRAQIQALVIQRDQALVKADMAVLRKMHAADYQLITPDGSIESRSQFLGDVAHGKLDYRTFKPISPIKIRLLGDAAAVRYESHIVIVVAGLGQIANDNWHTDLYQRRSGHWQLVWSQATPVGGLPAPTQP